MTQKRKEMEEFRAWKERNRPAATINADRTVSVDLPLLLHRAREAGSKFSKWYKGRGVRQLEERLETMQVTRRELELLKEIKKLKEETK